MKSDRELLELAAKAAGIAVDGVSPEGVWVYQEGFDCHGIGQGLPHLWNPLDFDGDALRLAASLGLQYEIDREPGSGTLTRQSRPIRVRVWASGWHKVDVGTDIDPDLITAIRSAIVRAAAAIGEAMP